MGLRADRMGSRHLRRRGWVSIAFTGGTSFSLVASHQVGKAGIPIFVDMAEREGFEPPIPVKVCLISSQVHSTALPPLQTLAINYLR